MRFIPACAECKQADSFFTTKGSPSNVGTARSAANGSIPLIENDRMNGDPLILKVVRIRAPF